MLLTEIVNFAGIKFTGCSNNKECVCSKFVSSTGSIKDEGFPLEVIIISPSFFSSFKTDAVFNLKSLDGMNFIINLSNLLLYILSNVS